MIYRFVGLCKALSLILCQGIIQTSAELLQIGPIETKLKWKLTQIYLFFIPENTFENGVCKMAAIYLSLSVLIEMGTILQSQSPPCNLWIVWL